MTDFTFYKDEYKGSTIVDQIPFEELELRASEFLISYVPKPIDTENASIEVKKCVCKLAELIYIDVNNLRKTSESLGSYSVTYATGYALAETSKSLENRMVYYIRVYLGKTGLLFIG